MSEIAERSFSLQRLKFERLSRNISQKEMADSLGISANAYYKKESGRLNITVEELSVLLKTLGIPEEDAGIFFNFIVPERERKEGN